MIDFSTITTNRIGMIIATGYNTQAYLAPKIFGAIPAR